MTSATANALARTTGGCLDNVKAEAETVAGPRTEPQITWPRNSVGEYTTIAELMSEATATDRPRGAIAFAIQADIWIGYAVIAVRRYLIRFGPSLASGASVSRSQFGATHE